MNTAEFRSTVNGSIIARPSLGVSPDFIVESLRSKLEDATTRARDLGLSGGEIAGLKQRIIAAAEQTWMAARYPTLNMEFAERRQRFLLERSAKFEREIIIVEHPAPDTTPAKNQTIVSLPVFICVWMDYGAMQSHFLDEDDQWRGESYRERCGQFPAYKQGGRSFSRLDVHAQAEMPSGITQPMLTSLRRALAYRQLFDVLLFDQQIRNNDGNERVGILWAPTDEAWSFTGTAPRPKGDPALLVRYDQTVYLVGYFDTPEEKSITNLIREFTEGPLQNT